MELSIKAHIFLNHIIQTLRAKEFHCALASQQETYRKTHLWKTKGLKDCFDHFYCSSDIGFLKNDTRFFDTVIQDLKEISLITSVEEILFWDDTQKCVDTVKACKIEAVLFTDNKDIFGYKLV